MFETLFSKILKMDIQYLNNHRYSYPKGYFIYCFTYTVFSSNDLDNIILYYLNIIFQ